MTYQEKVAKAEECFRMILLGQSLKDINTYLKNEGLNYIDTSKVLKSIEVFILEKYENIARTEFETPKDFLNNWKDSNISSDVYTLVFNHILEKHKEDKKNYINDRLRKEIPLEWIIDEAQDEFFSADDITQYIEKRKLTLELDKHAEVSDPNKRNKGLSFIFFGIIFTIIFLIAGRFSFGGIVLIIVGIFLLFAKKNN